MPGVAGDAIPVAGGRGAASAAHRRRRRRRSRALRRAPAGGPRRSRRRRCCRGRTGSTIGPVPHRPRSVASALDGGGDRRPGVLHQPLLRVAERLGLAVGAGHHLGRDRRQGRPGRPARRRPRRSSSKIAGSSAGSAARGRGRALARRVGGHGRRSVADPAIRRIGARPAARRVDRTRARRARRDRRGARALERRRDGAPVVVARSAARRIGVQPSPAVAARRSMIRPRSQRVVAGEAGTAPGRRGRDTPPPAIAAGDRARPRSAA